MDCDDQDEIFIANNPKFIECTKHVEVDFHLIEDKFLQGLNSILSTSTLEQARVGKFMCQLDGVLGHSRVYIWLSLPSRVKPSFFFPLSTLIGQIFCLLVLNKFMKILKIN